MRNNQARKGFTIIEVVITMNLLILVILILYSFLLQILKVESFGFEQTKITEQARGGISQMVDELREANLGNNGAYAIENATADSITFYSDVDTDVTREKITYYYQNGAVLRTLIEPTGNPPQYDPNTAVTETIVESVLNGNIFSYYNGGYPLDTANNPLPQPLDLDAIRLIHIALQIDVTPTQAPHAMIIESDAQLRNFKDN